MRQRVDRRGRRWAEGMDKEIPIATRSKGLALSKLSMRFSSSSWCLVFARVKC